MRSNATTALRTTALTTGALLAFAANSWLCRAALRGDRLGSTIDPASFTALRIASGAVVLFLLCLARSPAPRSFRLGGSWGSALALCAYAIAFSFAYLELSAGVGALILFGAVQLTMFVGGFLSGQPPTALDGVGLTVACAGLVVLTLPGATAPAPLAALGMALAGIAWGLYSLRGRSERAAPLAVTAGNFARALPLALAPVAAWALFAMALPGSSLHASARGAGLAALSGGLTSGVGYAVWYAALPGLRAVQAGLVQLAVPVLTAAGGVLLLSERVSARLVLAAALVLSGIALAVVAPRVPQSRTIRK